MSLWFLIPLLGLVAVAQTTLVPLFSLEGLKLDLPLMVVVAWGLTSLPGEAAIWGFIAGAFLDLVSGMPFGTQTFALTVIGLLLGLVQTTIFRSNVILPPVAIALSTVAYNLLVLAVLSTVGWQIAWANYLVRITLPTALFNTIALPITYFPLRRLYRRLHPQVEW